MFKIHSKRVGKIRSNSTKNVCSSTNFSTIYKHADVGSVSKIDDKSLFNFESKTTLETSGEVVKLHSKRVEKL
jgi:hypothetical protein